jgi:hypothetical protein
MAMTKILDVAIGLAFVYVLLSVLCSGLNEWIAQSIGLRGRFLREGMLNLLSDRWFYLHLINHPLIAAYRRDSRGEAQHPSYLPSEAVAGALFRILKVKADQLENKPPADEGTLDVPQLIKAASRCRAEGYSIGSALLPLLNQANGDLAAANKAVAAWYDSSMERVTGWYKRRATRSLFVISAVLAALLNADSIEITRALMRSDSLREAVVKQAIETATTGKVAGIEIKGNAVVVLSKDGTRAVLEAGKRLETQGLPVGFSCLAPAFEESDGKAPTIGELLSGCKEVAGRASGAEWIFKVIGLLITAVAVTLGAPFWFNLLNRLVDIRGAGGKPDAIRGQAKKIDGLPST